MAIAILLVVGLLFWLAANSEPSQVAAVREADEAAQPSVDDSPAAVDVDEFAANPAAFRGRNVQLANVTVAAPIGTHAFWIDLPSGQPFLVRMAESVVAEGRTVRAGEVVSISGPVFERTAAVVSAWEQEGVITTEGQRMEVEFATDYIEARRVAGGQPAANP
jgi:hypothetical protein